MNSSICWVRPRATSSCIKKLDWRAGVVLCVLLAGSRLGIAAPAAEAGAAVAEKYGCRVCHRIGERGGTVGPDLNQVALRRSEAWLMRWLADPAAVKRGTVMPRFPWAPGEREAVIAWLRGFARPVDGAAIVARYGGGAPAGEALVKAYQCGACHKVGREAGRAGHSDLNTLRKRRDAESARRWLKNPEMEKPGTFMPDFHLAPAEVEAIVAYLYR